MHQDGITIDIMHQLHPTTRTHMFGTWFEGKKSSQKIYQICTSCAGNGSQGAIQGGSTNLMEYGTFLNSYKHF